MKKLAAASLPVILIIFCILFRPAVAGSEKFYWETELSPGSTVEIKGVNGDIQAFGTGGSMLEVEALKTSRRDDPSEVEIVVVPHEAGITICAVYPGPNNTCEPGDHGSLGARNNDVTVDFSIKVPYGVNFVGKTVNGGVSAQEISADATGRTVNGDVSVYCEGLAFAKTVNGSVFVDMGVTDLLDDMEFETVNGSITLNLLSSVNADLKAEVLNGGIKASFPLEVEGKWGPKKASTRLGSGGPLLHLKTVNGDIELNNRQ